MDEPIETESAPKTRGWGKKILTAAIYAVLIVAACAATYIWQHKKVAALTRELSEANSQVFRLNNSLSSLQEKYNQAKTTPVDTPISSPPNSTPPATQANLTLTINGAQYVNPDGTVTSGGSWFGVDVTLTNNTSSTISVNDSDFHLKDQQNNEYTEETIQNASTLPAGWVSLPNKDLAPGETIKGAVTFVMPNTTLKTFTFINDTKTYSVTSSN